MTISCINKLKVYNLRLEIQFMKFLGYILYIGLFYSNILISMLISYDTLELLLKIRCNVKLGVFHEPLKHLYTKTQCSERIIFFSAIHYIILSGTLSRVVYLK